MQLAFCIYKYFPFGGLQRDFLQIAKACQARGHRVRIYVMAWQGDKPAGFDIILVPKKGLSNHYQNQSYFQWVKAHLQANPVDCVVGFNKMPGLDVYFAGDTCYAEKVSHKGFWYKLSKRCKHYLAFEDAVFNRHSQTKVMVLTKQQISDFVQYYDTEQSRFYLLPPGIAQDRQYHPESKAKGKQFRQANQIDEHNFVMLQIGSDFKRKGVDRSLIAIAALPNELKQKVTFLVVGQDKPDAYQKMAKQLGIEQQVRFFAGRNDIADILFSANLLLHPARQEAAGMVLIEGLAAGVPIIVSGISGYAYHIHDANAGVILAEPFVQADLNQTVQNAITNHDQLLTWHNNAINYGKTADLYHLAQRAADIILGCDNHE
ncbi:glycosyltransferase family 4 protein [Gilliamella sp. Pas-s25]|uniref:glycosyltransferase family 4 protein n=1 Tax=Gilliamella sp. Pas-s25 TaxID=2687310 RepID=UPI00135EDE07|nr:glycosyltransferase family 4 protein [Gilliamella sp. Pas-s25]MWP63198.1 glycosyltransferase [Gilliamella sp. Pas-s25]